ncbi:MAG TPA: integrase core domain-containing protein [Acidimicrobiia bacterium]
MSGWFSDLQVVPRGARWVFGITAMVLVALSLDFDSAARLPIALLFYLTCPGLVLLDWVRVPDAFTKVALTVAASLTANILTVTLLLAAGAYSMPTGLAAVSAVAVTAATVSTLRGAKRLAIPAPRALVFGGSPRNWPLVVAPPVIPSVEEDVPEAESLPAVETTPTTDPIDDLGALVAKLSTGAEWQVASTDWNLSDGTPITVVYVIDKASRACVSIMTTTGPGRDIDVWSALMRAVPNWGIPARLVAPAKLISNPDYWRDSAEMLGFQVDTSTPPMLAKRFAQTLRKLGTNDGDPASIYELQRQLVSAAYFYNWERPHSSLQRRTPRAAYADMHPERPADVTVESSTVGRGEHLKVGLHEVAAPDRHAGQMITALTHDDLMLLFADTMPMGYVRLTPGKRVHRLSRWEDAEP